MVISQATLQKIEQYSTGEAEKAVPRSEGAWQERRDVVQASQTLGIAKSAAYYGLKQGWIKPVEARAGKGYAVSISGYKVDGQQFQTESWRQEYGRATEGRAVELSKKAELRRIAREANQQGVGEATGMFAQLTREAESHPEILERTGALIAAKPYLVEQQRREAPFISLSQEREQRKQAEIQMMGFGGYLQSEFGEGKSVIAEKTTYKFLPSADYLFGTNQEIQKSLYEGEKYLPPSFRTPDFLKPTGEFLIGGVKGIYQGIREKPVKAATIAALSFTAPIVFKELGAAGSWTLGKISMVSPTAAEVLGTIGTGLGTTIKYGLPAAYTYSVGKRVLAEPDWVSKGVKSGEIFGTEVLPMVAGYKAGTYTLRRMAATEELGIVKSKLSKSQLKTMEKQLAQAKELGFEQPKVKEISFKDIERLPKKAQKPLFEWLQARKSEIIVGGSAGTRTQELVPSLRPPKDVDLFSRAGAPEIYAKDLARTLGEAGVKTTLKGSAIYTSAGKAIEFHPYETSLKFNIEQVMPWYRTYRAGIVKTPSGISVLKLGSQAQMKVIGFYRYGAPRTKDILYAEQVAIPSLEKAKALRLSNQAPQLFSYGNIEAQYGTGISVKPSLSEATSTTNLVKSLGLESSYYSSKATSTIAPLFYPAYPSTKTPNIIFYPFTSRTKSPYPIKTPSSIPNYPFAPVRRSPIARNFYPSYPKKVSGGASFPPIYPVQEIISPPTTEEQKRVLGLDVPSLLRKVPRRKEMFKRKYIYIESLASLGLRGTKFEIPATSKIPKYYETGLQTRTRLKSHKIVSGIGLGSKAGRKVLWKNTL